MSTDDADSEADALTTHQQEVASVKTEDIRDSNAGSKATSLCGCGKSCMAMFDPMVIQEHVDSIRQMTKVKKEMYVMGALYRINPDSTRSRYGVRKRTRYDYRFEGHRICRNAFIIIYDVGEYVLKSLIKHVHTHGNAVPRVSKHIGKITKRKLTVDDIKNVVQFIKDYAAGHSLPISAAAVGDGDDTEPVYLAASTTKKRLHRQYQHCCEEAGSRCLKYQTFCTLWRHFCSHVKVHEEC